MCSSPLLNTSPADQMVPRASETLWQPQASARRERTAVALVHLLNSATAGHRAPCEHQSLLGGLRVRAYMIARILGR